jgi:2-polyprenyl-3-methyl-5-hydroxy-6-metoxy-1,4-benzoquinol methylase
MNRLINPRDRAVESGGTSNSALLYEVVREIAAHHLKGTATVADVGCGRGSLHAVLAGGFERYLGIDIVRHAEFPVSRDVEFIEANLDAPTLALPTVQADVVCCLETIEHVENPRALVRALVRLAKPGGLLIVTTPNQLSLLSKLSLVLKNEFVHFQERPGLYPAHLSALLEIDLRRIARENELENVEIVYTGEGRIALAARHWPRWLTSRRGSRGRAFSDNVILRGLKPTD